MQQRNAEGLTRAEYFTRLMPWCIQVRGKRAVPLNVLHYGWGGGWSVERVEEHIRKAYPFAKPHRTRIPLLGEASIKRKLAQAILRELDRIEAEFRLNPNARALIVRTRHQVVPTAAPPRSKG